MTMRSIGTASLALMALVLAVPVPAAAQDDARQEVTGQYNIDGMIDQAVRNISQRYNLNHEQHQKTLEMMNSGVNQFLQEHSDQIYPLIRDLMRAELDGRNLSVSQRKRIGKAAGPLVAEAKKIIEEYNQEWRNILSPEQQRLHDWDLHEMEGQFEMIRESFDKMSSGGAVENPVFPPPKIETPEPPRPTMPGPGIPQAPVEGTQQSSSRQSGEADMFEKYVEKFIKDYQLDAGQREAARSILREYQARVKKHRTTNKALYDAAKKKSEEASKVGDFEKAKKAEQEIDKLNARILALFEEMKVRLMSIPRESQIRAFKQKTEGKPATQPADKPTFKKPATPKEKK